MKILAIAALAGVLAQIPTCSSAPPTISTSAVITATTQTCQFIPTAETIINLVAANPVLNSAELVANAICAAVSPTGQALNAISGNTTDVVVTHYFAGGKSVPIIGHFKK